MKENDKHIDFYNKLESPFDKSEDDLWQMISSRTVEKPKSKVIRLSFVKYAVVAVLVLFVAVGGVMRFYTKTVTTRNSQHLSHVLPDGSVVTLNSDSKIEYKPLWWNLSRDLALSGEAFFDVKKGEKFSVHSVHASTHVLGTSFNIYSRDTDYKVFCKTGKVRVYSQESDVDVVITPGQLAVVNSLLKRGSVRDVDPQNEMGWKSNKFTFTSEELKKVFEELERQYDITVKVNNDSISEFKLTGYFSKSRSVEPMLDIVCKSFNLKYVKIDKKRYKVSRIRN